MGKGSKSPAKPPSLSGTKSEKKQQQSSSLLGALQSADRRVHLCYLTLGALAAALLVALPGGGGGGGGGQLAKQGAVGLKANIAQRDTELERAKTTLPLEALDVGQHKVPFLQHSMQSLYDKGQADKIRDPQIWLGLSEQMLQKGDFEGGVRGLKIASHYGCRADIWMSLGKALQQLARITYQKMSQSQGPNAAAAAAQPLLAELRGMRMTALQRRAVDEGLTSDQIDDAMESDDPKAALISLLVDASAGSQGKDTQLSPSDPRAPPAVMMYEAIAAYEIAAQMSTRVADIAMKERSKLLGQQVPGSNSCGASDCVRYARESKAFEHLMAKKYMNATNALCIDEDAVSIPITAQEREERCA